MKEKQKSIQFFKTKQIRPDKPYLEKNSKRKRTIIEALAKELEQIRKFQQKAIFENTALANEFFVEGYPVVQKDTFKGMMWTGRTEEMRTCTAKQETNHPEANQSTKQNN